MSRLVINPVTRIEGHGEVRIDLNPKGELERAHFSVVELRGFEKFLIGAAVEEAPRITPRICGICPTAHHVAAAKALDRIYGVEPPAAGLKLRELLMLGQYIHSHALHFFMLSAPDFLAGEGAGPSERNVIGLANKAGDLVKKAILVRKFGQRVTEAVGGKPIHPATAVPGGMSHPLPEAQRSSLHETAKEVAGIAVENWELARTILDRTDRFLGTVQTGFAALQKEGLFSIYGGDVKITGPDGAELGTFRGEEYTSHVEEYTEPWSYLKFCRLKQGIPYRVGPLARLNIVKGMGTTEADRALSEYRKTFGHPIQSPLAYNVARYVEFIWACERAVALLGDPTLTDPKVRTSPGGVVNRRGVGVIEAPRGTLIHDYTVNGSGVIERCNLIVATCQNNYAMDRSVEEVARKEISGGRLTEQGANRIETVIRAYDPCLSCATHLLEAGTAGIGRRAFIKICISGGKDETE